MSPIDEVRPAQAANWVRRPDERRKRRDQAAERRNDPKKDTDRAPKGEPPDHIVDELA